VAILLALVAIVGVVIGSFLNVVVYRLPAGRSIVSPPSACGSCGHPVHRRDNVPIVSWLVLRGRCRDCGARISVRYPLVEAGTGLAFLVVALVFLPPVVEASSAEGVTAAVLVLVAFLYLASISIALALIDLDTHRLPDAIVLPSYLVGGVLLAGASILNGDPGALLRTGIALVGLFGVYLAMALAYPGGMGFGDVKLAGVLGMYLGWLGWGSLAVGAFAPFVVGGLFAVALIVARRAGRKSRIPFGPWMLVGAWIGVLWGAAIFNSYLQLFGLV
jgi:leader peptidase (prepilin peptidase)/N-methyltransferase